MQTGSDILSNIYFQVYSDPKNNQSNFNDMIQPVKHQSHDQSITQQSTYTQRTQFPNDQAATSSLESFNSNLEIEGKSSQQLKDSLSQAAGVAATSSSTYHQSQNPLDFSTKHSNPNQFNELNLMKPWQSTQIPVYESFAACKNQHFFTKQGLKEEINGGNGYRQSEGLTQIDRGGITSTTGENSSDQGNQKRLSNLNFSNYNNTYSNESEQRNALSLFSSALLNQTANRNDEWQSSSQSSLQMAPNNNNNNNYAYTSTISFNKGLSSVPIENYHLKLPTILGKFESTQTNQSGCNVLGTSHKRQQSEGSSLYFDRNHSQTQHHGSIHHSNQKSTTQFSSSSYNIASSLWMNELPSADESPSSSSQSSMPSSSSLSSAVSFAALKEKQKGSGYYSNYSPSSMSNSQAMTDSSISQPANSAVSSKQHSNTLTGIVSPGGNYNLLPAQPPVSSQQSKKSLSSSQSHQQLIEQQLQGERRSYNDQVQCNSEVQLGGEGKTLQKQQTRNQGTFDSEKITNGCQQLQSVIEKLKANIMSDFENLSQKIVNERVYDSIVFVNGTRTGAVLLKECALGPDTKVRFSFAGNQVFADVCSVNVTSSKQGKLTAVTGDVTGTAALIGTYSAMLVEGNEKLGEFINVTTMPMKGSVEVDPADTVDNGSDIFSSPEQNEKRGLMNKPIFTARNRFTNLSPEISRESLQEQQSQFIEYNLNENLLGSSLNPMIELKQNSKSTSAIEKENPPKISERQVFSNLPPSNYNQYSATNFSLQQQQPALQSRYLSETAQSNSYYQQQEQQQLHSIQFNKNSSPLLSFMLNQQKANEVISNNSQILRSPMQNMDEMHELSVVDQSSGDLNSEKLTPCFEGPSSSSIQRKNFTNNNLTSTSPFCLPDCSNSFSELAEQIKIYSDTSLNTNNRASNRRGEHCMESLEPLVVEELLSSVQMQQLQRNRSDDKDDEDGVIMNTENTDYLSESQQYQTKEEEEEIRERKEQYLSQEIEKREGGIKELSMSQRVESEGDDENLRNYFNGYIAEVQQQQQLLSQYHSNPIICLPTSPSTAGILTSPASNTSITFYNNNNKQQNLHYSTTESPVLFASPDIQVHQLQEQQQEMEEKEEQMMDQDEIQNENRMEFFTEQEVSNFESNRIEIAKSSQQHSTIDLIQSDIESLEANESNHVIISQGPPIQCLVKDIPSEESVNVVFEPAQSTCKVESNPQCFVLNIPTPKIQLIQKSITKNQEPEVSVVSNMHNIDSNTVVYDRFQPLEEQKSISETPVEQIKATSSVRFSTYLKQHRDDKSKSELASPFQYFDPSKEIPAQHSQIPIPTSYRGSTTTKTNFFTSPPMEDKMRRRATNQSSTSNTGSHFKDYLSDARLRTPTAIQSAYSPRILPGRVTTITTHTLEQSTHSSASLSSSQSSVQLSNMLQPSRLFTEPTFNRLLFSDIPDTQKSVEEAAVTRIIATEPSFSNSEYPQKDVSAQVVAPADSVISNLVGGSQSSPMKTDHIKKRSSSCILSFPETRTMAESLPESKSQKSALKPTTFKEIQQFHSVSLGKIETERTEDSDDDSFIVVSLNRSINSMQSKTILKKSILGSPAIIPIITPDQSSISSITSVKKSQKSISFNPNIEEVYKFESESNSMYKKSKGVTTSTVPIRSKSPMCIVNPQNRFPSISNRAGFLTSCTGTNETDKQVSQTSLSQSSSSSSLGLNLSHSNSNNNNHSTNSSGQGILARRTSSTLGGEKHQTKSDRTSNAPTTLLKYSSSNSSLLKTSKSGSMSFLEYSKLAKQKTS